MLKAKVDFLNYLHNLVAQQQDSEINNCLTKIKTMNLPIYEQLINKHFTHISDLVANIMVEYFKLFLDKHEHEHNTHAIKQLREQLPEKYFKRLPLKTFKQWLAEPTSISHKSLLEMTNGNKYDYSELLYNQGFLNKPTFKGNKVYMIISDYGYHDPWEPTDETDVRLIGICSSQAEVNKLIKENTTVSYGDIQIIPTYLNQVAFDDKRWQEYEHSFSSEQPDKHDLLPEICRDFSYDESMYENPDDI